MADELNLSSSNSPALVRTIEDSKCCEVKLKGCQLVKTPSKEVKDALISECCREIESLQAYFREVACRRIRLEDDQSCAGAPSNSFVACLLEESNLPFSRLVEELFERLKLTDGVTLASVRSAVLFVGQRSMYGTPSADADVLEDESESSLWCWETRDLKLLPKSQRGILSIRRTCRKKIHERITALSGLLTTLSSLEAHPNVKNELVKAYERLGKTLNEAQIRSLIENLLHKNDMEMVSKEAKLKARELLKEFERSRREAEKERKRADREMLKEKIQNEKCRKRQMEEAEKAERRREKDESELRRQLKRQQDDAEKDQKQRGKQEAEIKKLHAIQKQAIIMERFLKRSKIDGDAQHTGSPLKEATVTVCEKLENTGMITPPVTCLMDVVLSKDADADCCDLLKSHMDVWHNLGQSIRCNKFQHWCIRRRQNAPTVIDLKLQSLSEAEASMGSASQDKEARSEKPPDVWEKMTADSDMVSCQRNLGRSSLVVLVQDQTKKLLQFDKSYRPPYYGTWSRRSDVIGPRHPMRKDPNLDYDVDSDDEWEEEDPGECLSECEKDDEEETLEGGNEDGSEDSFMVPDGYLSEDEGVELDSMAVDYDDETKNDLCSTMQDADGEDSRSFTEGQKWVNHVTEQALRKNQPLIISNLLHEKSTLPTSDDITGVSRFEQLCLRALRVRPCYDGANVELSASHDMPCGNQKSSRRSENAKEPTLAVMSESDLLRIVSSIQSCTGGINKLVQLLSKKFPFFSKKQLKQKVRDLADFVDNRWQVKKSVMKQFELLATPEKEPKLKGVISSFFSKRCMPSSGEVVNVSESPPWCKSKKKKGRPQCTITPWFFGGRGRESAFRTRPSPRFMKNRQYD